MLLYSLMQSMTSQSGLTGLQQLRELAASGGAVHSQLGPTQGLTTLELKVAYHQAITADTGLVRAEGRIVKFGRRAAFAEARLTDAEGHLYATATSTLLVFER